MQKLSSSTVLNCLQAMKEVLLQADVRRKLLHNQARQFGASGWQKGALQSHTSASAVVVFCLEEPDQLTAVA